MPDLAARLAGLNPFPSSESGDDDEDYGQAIEPGTIAGGGHAARRSEITSHQLRVSHALRSFLVHAGLLSAEDAAVEDAPALRALVDKPHAVVPRALTDRAHPLAHYFVSSSHNTYLLAHQLYGTSSAAAYETVLRAGARCIEIDAWDGEDDREEPKVTHGYTLVSHVPFRAVCEAIRDVVDAEAAEWERSGGGVRRSGGGAGDSGAGGGGDDGERETTYRPAPVLVSLENHCGAYGQLRLVQIMKEVWGERLLSEEVRRKGHAEQEEDGSPVRLEELGSKIVLIVEYHFPEDGSGDGSDSSGDSSTDGDDDDDDDDEEARRARREYKARKKSTSKTAVIPELAALGVYAQSVKPRDHSWFDPGRLRDGPRHHLINVSESGLGSILAAGAGDVHDRVAAHNARHLMRVFPKGTRISSRNLDPLRFWSVGAHVCALNWQTFNAAMQLNEALFAGTDGFVLKPAALRGGADGPGPVAGRTARRRRRRLRLHVAGATDVPVPRGRAPDDLRPYVTCTLFHPRRLPAGQAKQKTPAYRHHRVLGFLHHGENPPATDPVWVWGGGGAEEVLEWTFEDDELVFLRLAIKSDDRFARNPVLAVAAVRLLYAAPGWRFIRMLDLRGRETRCSLLVKFELEDADEP